jgi:hypothetical protein
VGGLRVRTSNLPTTPTCARSHSPLDPSRCRPSPQSPRTGTCPLPCGSLPPPVPGSAAAAAAAFVAERLPGCRWSLDPSSSPTRGCWPLPPPPPPRSWRFLRRGGASSSDRCGTAVGFRRRMREEGATRAPAKEEALFCGLFRVRRRRRRRRRRNDGEASESAEVRGVGASRHGVIRLDGASLKTYCQRDSPRLNFIYTVR